MLLLRCPKFVIALFSLGPLCVILPSLSARGPLFSHIPLKVSSYVDQWGTAFEVWAEPRNWKHTRGRRKRWEKKLKGRYFLLGRWIRRDIPSFPPSCTSSGEKRNINLFCEIKREKERDGIRPRTHANTIASSPVDLKNGKMETSQLVKICPAILLAHSEKSLKLEIVMSKAMPYRGEAGGRAARRGAGGISFFFFHFPEAASTLASHGGEWAPLTGLSTRLWSTKEDRGVGRPLSTHARSTQHYSKLKSGRTDRANRLRRHFPFFSFLLFFWLFFVERHLDTTTNFFFFFFSFFAALPLFFSMKGENKNTCPALWWWIPLLPLRFQQWLAFFLFFQRLIASVLPAKWKQQNGI